jgi:hypothetical protein
VRRLRWLRPLFGLKASPPSAAAPAEGATVGG